MTARAKPGAEFEAAFRRSVPKGVYVRRLPTPSAVGFRVPQLVELAEGLFLAVRRLVASAEKDAARLDGMPLPASWAAGVYRSAGVPGDFLPEWVANMRRFGFTPKAGFDLQLTAPAFSAPSHDLLFEIPGNVPLACAVRPSIVLDLELKSVAVDRLDFANVDPAQEKALAAGAAAGHVAALVVEFRKAGEVWVLPIQVWQEYRLTAQRSSMPLADARRLGMPILRDEGRGLKLPYWRVADWLRACGGEIP